MVGVKGFEPSAPTSRTYGIEANHIDFPTFYLQRFVVFCSFLRQSSPVVGQWLDEAVYV